MLQNFLFWLKMKMDFFFHLRMEHIKYQSIVGNIFNDLSNVYVQLYNREIKERYHYDENKSELSLF